MSIADRHWRVFFVACAAIACAVTVVRANAHAIVGPPVPRVVAHGRFGEPTAPGARAFRGPQASRGSTHDIE